jgi:Acyltransferase
MIRAKHKQLAVWFFDWYLTWIIRKDFKELHIELPELPKGKSILVLANHFSWWDGFWQVYVNRFYFRKRYHVMMLERELKKRILLRYAGSYSVNPGDRSVIESIHYTLEVLEQPKNMAVLFPQGKIESMQSGNIVFEKGAMRIIQQVSYECCILMCVATVEYGSYRKPSVWLHYKIYQEIDGQVDEVYNSFYHECRMRIKKGLK